MRQRLGLARPFAACHTPDCHLSVLSPRPLLARRYSFAIVAWELAAKQTLLFNRTRTAGAGARTEVTPEFWAEAAARRGARPERRDALPPALWDLMTACWAAQPARRPPFADVENALAAQRARLDPAGVAAQGGLLHPRRRAPQPQPQASCCGVQ